MAAIKSKTVQALRVLLPSWRFFDVPGAGLEIFFRAGPSESELGQWVPLLKPVPRTFRALLSNPEGNLYLACHSLLQRVELEVGELCEANRDRFPESVSFQLLLQMVRYFGPADHGLRDKMKFQFKVSRLDQIGSAPFAVPGSGATEDFLISEVSEA